ncbi:MAG TPA: DUF397 domain-containing protein [Pseudonocardia sp.]
MDLTRAQWRKSTYSTSSGDGENCVEVALLPGGAVAVRDTKDRSRPAHRYPATEWAHFLAAVRAGTLR